MNVQTLFTGIAALGLVGGAIYLAVEGATIPTELASALTLALGYLFGRPDVNLPTGKAKE